MLLNLVKSAKTAMIPISVIRKDIFVCKISFPPISPLLKSDLNMAKFWLVHFNAFHLTYFWLSLHSCGNICRLIFKWTYTYHAYLSTFYARIGGKQKRKQSQQPSNLCLTIWYYATQALHSIILKLIFLWKHPGSGGFCLPIYILNVL